MRSKPRIDLAVVAFSFLVFVTHADRVLAQTPGAASGPPTDTTSPLYETTVVAARREERVFETPRSVEILRREGLDRQMVRTAPEALMEQAGVFVQRTNYGGGMPIIRGQHGNRILLLVDGIRINNSTTRSGPNQFLNTVDPLLVERIEVLRGTGSALHGSDALGGTINVVTESARVRGDGRVTGSTILRGATFDESASLGARLRWSGERVGVNGSASGRHFGDLRGGEEAGVQPFNGYDEWNASAAVAVAAGDRGTLMGTVQTTQQRNVLRTYGSTPTDFRRFSLQARTLAYLRYETNGLGPIDSFRATASYHYQNEQFDRYRIGRNIHLREDTSIGTISGQIEATIRSEKRGSLTTGVEVYVDDVTTKGARGLISEGTLTYAPELSRYAPGAGYATAAVFGAYTLPLGERFKLTSELRMGAVSVSLPDDQRLTLLFPSQGLSSLGEHSEVVPVYAGGLYARYALHPNVGVYTGGSLGFRAPNLDDYSRLGVEGTGYITPTRDLRPERALSGELGLKAATERAEFSIAYAYTYIFDAMTRVPWSIGTLTSLDGAPVTRVQNGDSARFSSFELSGYVPVWRRLAVFGNNTFTRGDQRRRAEGPMEIFINEPAAKIPPMFGMAGVGWRQPGNWSAEGFVRYALKQDRLAEVDRTDTRICPDVPGRCEGTPGWAVLGVRASATLTKTLRAGFAVENLTNASYRMHASGIDGAGRGFIATLEGVLP